MSIENPTAGWGKIRWKALQDFPPFTTLSGANTLKNTSFATGSDKIHLDLIRCQRQAPVPIATFRAENERRQLCWYLNKIWLLLTWQSYGTEPHKAQHFSSEAAWGSIECFRMFSRFFADIAIHVVHGSPFLCWRSFSDFWLALSTLPDMACCLEWIPWAWSSWCGRLLNAKMAAHRTWSSWMMRDNHR